jgi:membrane protease YdiL (CAAX protease family)
VLIFKVGLAVAPQSAGLIRLLVFASTVLLPVVLTQAMGLWSEVGLTRIKPTRVFFLSLVSCALFLSRGLHLPGSNPGSEVLMQFLNAFGEELLFRGVIFAVLISVPRWQAIFLSGVLFGSMHLIHGVMEGDWGGAFAQMLVTSAAGFLFAAVRDATGSLWLTILLHMLLNLSIIYSNLEPSAGQATYFAVARIVNVFECAMAIYVVARVRRYAEQGG